MSAVTDLLDQAAICHALADDIRAGTPIALRDSARLRRTWALEAAQDEAGVEAAWARARERIRRRLAFAEVGKALMWLGLGMALGGML